MNYPFLTLFIMFLAIIPCSGQIPSASEKPLGLSTYRFDLNDTQHYTPASITREPSGFVIAGTNFSSQIERCKSINGHSIEKLERLMRPGNRDERGSMSGFLGKDENLLDVLVADNDFVRQQGFTHRQLAIPLLQISQRAIGKMRTGRPPFEFQHAGTNWRVNFTFTRGYQFSPFGDGTKTQCDFTVTNLDNKKSLEFSGLVPLMIERYGFYEGEGTSYRVPPADIIKVLGLESSGR